MSLVESLDALLALVDGEQAPFDVSRFEALDREVYLEARRLGLQDDLPQPDASSFVDPQDAQFIGKTKLAGMWLLGGQFIPMPARQWRADLLVLRSLATSTAPTPPTEAEPDVPKAKRGKRRQSSKPRPLTPKQTEALQIVGECGGDIAEAARRLGKDRKTVEQHYQAGLAKLGRAMGRKPKVEQLRNGLRGQPEVTAEDDRRARIRPVDRRRAD